MHHTPKTDPRRSARYTPPAARAPQRAARIARSGAVALEGEQNEQADELSAPPRRARSAPVTGARKRVRRATRKSGKMGRAHLILFTVSGMLCLVLLAMISIVHADYQHIKARADSKAELLAVLREQQRTAKRRLAALESGKGHEQLLLDHGYIRPGDRILLFPATVEERRKREIPKNDLAPHLPAGMEGGHNGASAWRRAGAVLGGWWDTIQDAAGLKPDKAQRPAQE